MSGAISAYPLTWPQGFPRVKYRQGGAFKTSLAGALDNVQRSLKLFAQDSGKKLERVVISSNVTLGEQRPADPGVAVWFSWDGLQVCIPVDRYEKVEANLQAIHHIIEARRVELRHGGLAIVRATFTGFRALPAPAGEKPWREVFGFPVGESVSMTLLEQRYREHRSKSHPDKGGTDAAFQAVQRAFEAGCIELGNPP